MEYVSCLTEQKMELKQILWKSNRNYDFTQTILLSNAMPIKFFPPLKSSCFLNIVEVLIFNLTSIV